MTHSHFLKHLSAAALTVVSPAHVYIDLHFESIASMPLLTHMLLLLAATAWLLGCLVVDAADHDADHSSSHHVTTLMNGLI
jgi:hypothetical protein